jgi:hypothetical protein
MELDLQSLLGLHVTWCAQQLLSLAETPQPPLPRIRARTTSGTIGQLRHLLVTPWIQRKGEEKVPVVADENHHPFQKNI